MEFEWNIFSGYNTLQLNEEDKSLLLRLDETPEIFTRIIFMSMFSDISCGSKDNEKECLANAKLFLCLHRDLDKVLKRSGTVSVKTVFGECGTIWLKGCCWNSQKSGCPIFRATSPLSRGRLKSKGHGKLSIHYAAELETIETIFRIFVSANQLSLYGAIAKICEENETLHERTEKPVVMEQSSSSLVLSVIKTEVPLDCHDLAHKDILLQQYGERIEKLSQQDK